MGERELNVSETCSRIKSTSVAERVKALGDLAHIFRHNEHSYNWDSLPDKSWHGIFESLFHVATADRSSFLKAPRGAVASRLEKCAGTLRVVVEAGAQRIRLRTAKAVLDHIMETLPVTSGYCTPLSLDYLKCLRMILEYQPHVEHLRDKWHEIAGFVTDGIALLRGQSPAEPRSAYIDVTEDTDSVEPLATPGATLHSTLPTSNASVKASSRSGTPKPTTRSSRPSKSSMEVEELVLCLHQLVKAPNAPLNEQREEILAAAIAFLDSFKSIGRAHVDALATINLVLARTLQESTAIINRTVRLLLPLLKDYWSSKSAPFRDEIFVTLVLTKSHVIRLLPNAIKLYETFAATVESFLDAMISDYCKKQEKEQLQLDELILSLNPRKQGIRCFANPTFQLRPYVLRGEASWTALQIIAEVSAAFDTARRHLSVGIGEDGGQRKRTRPSLYFEDCFTTATSSSGSTQLGSIQMLAFAVHLRSFGPVELQDIVGRLATLINDSKGPVSSWTMTALSACAVQQASSSSLLRPTWIRIWKLASRNVTLQASCRAACHLLNILLKLRLISYQDAVAEVDVLLTSPDLNGPAIVAETTIAFWLTLTSLQASESPSNASETPERIIRWLFSRWTPSKFDDRNYTSGLASTSSVADVLGLLASFTTVESPPVPCRYFETSGTIGQSWNVINRNASLTAYLLLSDRSKDQSNLTLDEKQDTESAGRKSTRRPTAKALKLDVLVADFCCSEAQKCLQSWTGMVNERPSSITSEMVRFIAMVCAVNDAVAASKTNANPQRLASLRITNAALIKELCNFLSRAECDLAKVDAVLEVVAQIVPTLAEFEQLNDALPSRAQAISLAFQICNALRTRLHVQDSHRGDRNDDLMDLDDGFESQTSGPKRIESYYHSPRDQVALSSDIVSFRACILGYTRFLAPLLDATPSAGLEIPSTFMEYLLSLSPSELCASRSLLQIVFMSNLPLPYAGVEELIERFAAIFLQEYAFERHEVALAATLDLLIGCTDQWTDPEHKPLFDAAGDVYKWFVTTAVSNSLCSTMVEQRISDLFFNLLKVRGPDFKPFDSIPSVRTGLFGRLKEGANTVVYGIALELHTFFDRFVLGEHETVFSDVYSSLPDNCEFLEGLALRIFVLAQLGSKWPTLLRRCLYHIFETAGMLPSTTGYATWCVRSLASELELQTARELFNVFAPQFLYSWLPLQSISHLPFEIFGFRSLAELLEDCQEELFAQLTMRNIVNELRILENILKSSNQELLRRSFARTVAYCLAWDADTSRKEGTTTSENTIKGELGAELYIELLQLHFPHILGILLPSYEGDNIQKYVYAREEMRAASTALKEMIATSSSANRKLPAELQPLFSGKTLMDKIKRLCRRVGKDPMSIWSPELFTYVLRMLINRLNPAFGSLQACSTVRKIRLLVSLAGPVALEGYPLEMAIHALQPLMVDKQCADDTIGVVQYLLHHGQPYLASSVPFATNVIVTTLVLLRQFAASSQESTTQESHHRATIDRAAKFHAWITQTWCTTFTKQLSSSGSSTLKAFTSIVRSAGQARAEANAVEGTAESQLLRELFDDQRSGRLLLQGPPRAELFRIFCSRFQAPTSYRQDILGLDSLATTYAEEVWKSCRGSKVSEKYLLWAAKVIGRAQVASGKARSILRSSFDGFPKVTLGRGGNFIPGLSSSARIVDALLDQLRSSDRRAVCIVEEILRAALSRNIQSNEMAEFTELFPPAVVAAMVLETPDRTSPIITPPYQPLQKVLEVRDEQPLDNWLRDITVTFCSVAAQDSPILPCLPPALLSVAGLAERLFAQVLHLILQNESVLRQSATKELISEAYKGWLLDLEQPRIPRLKVIINSLLYLRKQQRNESKVHTDWERWLDVDYRQAAQAAEFCGMHVTAVLFAELSQSIPDRGSRRSTISATPSIPTELLLKIYSNIDEPDSFYGIQQKPNLGSVLTRLDYEAEGMKSLLFRGAQMDSEVRRLREISDANTHGVISSLVNLNMSSITRAVVSSKGLRSEGSTVADETYQTARKLEQWDIIPAERPLSEESILYAVFQGINNSTNTESVRESVDLGFSNVLKVMLDTITSGQSAEWAVRTLGILTELDDTMTATSKEQLQDAWANISSRRGWMLSAQPKDVMPILSSRETLFSSLSKNSDLQRILQISTCDARDLETRNILSSCHIFKQLGQSQALLASATYLSDIIPSCQAIGLDIESQAQHQVADVLWSQGETLLSVRMLEQLVDRPGVRQASGDTQRSSLLAKVGHHIAEARLENPGVIMDKYLKPAITELKRNFSGDVAGQVLHEFATFCDRQLQNPESLEDYHRIQAVRDRRAKELEELTTMAKSSKSGTSKQRLKYEYTKAKRWYDIDDHEFCRLKAVRESFVTQSLENYLLSLTATDAFDNDVLRFFSIWLEYADNDLAMAATSQNLTKAPSRKFVVLMNQLSSRLLSEKTSFQQQLSELILRMCIEHPYQTLHNLFSSSHPSGSKDDAAKSRQSAAREIVRRLQSDKRSKRVSDSVFQADTIYHSLAIYNDKDSLHSGRDYPLEKVPAAKGLQKVAALKVPPATMNIALQKTIDYSGVPTITGFQPRMRIANGLSQPKIITAICSDGRTYKQLFKSGNDDLRQDAIMEQVFEQVSKLLQNHPATRQRSLHIRTYKVLPLSATSGIMEFVQNTIPLNDYVQPAHERYFPKDMKWSQCRKLISECDKEAVEKRVDEYKKVTAKFHPVLRYFFFERFKDPDDWFARRLAYTRSTAAISILGHVLGLGDRHCHNILLDEKTGEVVHIDLGVAFEGGRVLPVPEVVPFRLTRDIVDAMGLNGTEGVFRRCCEFTMDALREDRESIMTLLNVLRYDPLYSWTVSPLRAKRMQESEYGDRERAVDDKDKTQQQQQQPPSRRREDESGEASRALSVVEKKLSRTLSTAATVNELIQQATDEKNLAVLYCGWSAWA